MPLVNLHSKTEGKKTTPSAEVKKNSHTKDDGNKY